MNTNRLYEHTEQMLSDELLTNHDKLMMLSKWRNKTEDKISSHILTSKEIKEASEFLAYLSLKRAAIELTQ